MTMDLQTLSMVALLISVVLPVMLKLAEVGMQLVLLHLPAAKAEQVRQAVNDVVAAVEQANQAVPGQTKKAIATQMIGVLMRQRGLAATPEQIDVLLEAAVRSINLANAANALPPATASAPAPTSVTGASGRGNELAGQDAMPTMVMRAMRPGTGRY